MQVLIKHPYKIGKIITRTVSTRIDGDYVKIAGSMYKLSTTKTNLAGQDVYTVEVLK